MALTKLTTDLIDGSLGTDWQATPKTANFTAVVGEGYFVNTTSAAITVTLPSPPSAGNEVSIVDYAGTANTNNITITSGDNINGAADDLAINYNRGGVSMVYVDATQGWIAYNAANETASALGEISTAYNIDYLLVAGGGGGGNNDGGGGGAGGLLESTISAIDTGNTLTVTIGSGGGGAIASVYQSSPGSDSTIASSAITTIRTIGGGAGKTQLTSNGDGGSGGGGQLGTYRFGGSGTPGQGNDGGDGSSTGVYAGGGGGGAGAAGSDGTSSGGGAGGVGATTTIISGSNATTSSIGEIVSSSLYFAGGGGAGEELISGNAYGVGGYGGGGDGNSEGDAENGTPNTGGGGGGAGYTTSHYNAGNGGSGVCILRMPTASYSGTTTGTPDVYTEGSDTVLVYKTGGTYTT